MTLPDMVIAEKIITKKEEIWLEDDVIVRVKPNEGFEFDETDVQRQFETYSKLGIGKTNKALLLADGTAHFIMTKEARELSAKMAKDYFIAGAIIGNSLATRLLVNFLNSFHTFDIPLKLFRNEDEALKWLRKKI